MKDKKIRYSPLLSKEEIENLMNEATQKEMQKAITGIINKNTLKIMEEDKREKPAKNLKSKFFSNSPLSKEQFEYLKNGEGVDNKDVDGETGFF